MNYNEEVANLTVGKDMNFLKLESGTHKVEFLDDGTPKEVVINDKRIPKVFYRVKYNDVEYVWTITKGKSLNSLYGQIAIYARKFGSIEGHTITVFVKGSGMEKDYTVSEALDLIKEEEESRKLPVQEKVS